MKLGTGVLYKEPSSKRELRENWCGERHKRRKEVHKILLHFLEFLSDWIKFRAENSTRTRAFREKSV
jgi:hypothetical protein